MNLIRKTIREALATPGFTMLYIIGVSFTVMFTMVYAIILYSQLCPVYPEYDRPSTIYLAGINISNDELAMNGGFSQSFIDQYLRGKLKSVSDITAINTYNPDYPMVQTNGNGPEFHVEMRNVEPSFFCFYDYEFLAGKPFSQADFDSRLHVAAISDKVAQRLFTSPEDAIGKDIKINNVRYRISGVFREGSALCIDSYGEVFVPYTLSNSLSNFFNQYPIIQNSGTLEVMVKVKPGKEKLLRNELEEICRRINAIDSTSPKLRIPFIETHTEHVFSSYEDYDSEPGQTAIAESKGILALWRPLLTGLLVVLVIPALNISGLIGSRMDKMASEIGIRRSFGATRSSLMRMVMTENMVLTVAGGIIGLALSWIIMACAGDMLLKFTPLAYHSGSSAGNSAAFITGEIAFAPVVFIITIVVCLLLNTLSAWIPARRAMRRQITESINSKR